MESTTPADLADLAEDVARRAAAIVRRARAGTIRVADRKSSDTDLVTDTDREVEAFIIAELTAARAGDAILGEETGSHAGTSGVTWIIDPIDGTTNFFYDLPGFNVSIAAAHRGRVVAGVVVDPVRDETFRATLGGGATCNAAPLRTGSGTDLGRALVATGFSYDPARRRDQADVVARIIDRVRDIRRNGAAAIDLCSVASGRVDAYFESGLQAWDLAAGGLVAAEAGCVLHGPATAAPDGRLVVAAAPGIADAFTELLADVAAEGLHVADPSARTGWEFGRLGS